MKPAYRKIFDSEFELSLKSGLAVAQDFPQSAKSLIKIAARQSKAQKLREKWAEQDIFVPPLLIVSTTDKCNLHCTGCYAAAGCAEPKTALTRGQIDKVLAEAVGAGVSAVLLAGGEPLLCKDWLEAASNQPDLLGLVFTNGTLVDAAWVEWFNKNRNIIPLFSVEGMDKATDNRRGEGVSQKIFEAITALSIARIPFGISVTTGGHNIAEVTSPEFINPYLELGCRLVIHVEYVPVDESGELYILTEEEKSRLDTYCRKSMSAGKALYISFPGDEERFGGCLAAGRGFVHMNAAGSLEPCPFAPHSDSSVCASSFIDALKSPLLSYIRQNSAILHEGKGGCALRGQSALLKQIAAQSR